MLLRLDETTNAPTMATSSSNGDVVADIKSPSWTAETNWTVSGGSVDSLITVESLDSPIDSESLDAGDDKPPVVLVPQSSDSGPCEIKLKFSQKHEVRQVYVRSTARIFEIYLAPSLSSNEYLCTVRCGMAARDDGILHATQAGEHNGSNSNGCAGEQGIGKSKDNGNIPANEDGWIEVKVPDSSLHNNQHNSMPINNKHSQEASNQELYEATAEITDADACISLTLRLLSLQTKDWLYVDEIYVLADPVDPTDTETQPPELGSSTGTSLMAMLVPTLLNLSRSGNIQRQTNQTFDAEESKESPGVGMRATAIETKQEVAGTQQEVNEDSHRSRHLHIPEQAADAKLDGASNGSDDKIAKTLELLLSRVSRIEDICSSFEQSMLKPINSIERRLQMVEEQLQVLSTNPQHSATSPRPSTRIVAPPFSCTETNASSEKKDSPVEVSSNTSIEPSIPVHIPRFAPGLVVTAPEFSCGDDDESDDDVEPSTDVPSEIKKKAVSVDDALAAALAGFISATSAPPSRYIQTLAVKAPEFVLDEDDSTSASPSCQSSQNVVLVSPRYVNGSASSSSSIPLLPALKQRVDDSGDNYLQDTVGVAEKVQFGDDSGNNYLEDTLEGVAEKVQFNDNSGNNYLEDTLGVTEKVQLDDEDTCQTAQPELLLAQKGDSHIVEATSKGEATDVSIVSDSERSDIVQQFAGLPIEDACETENRSATETAGDVLKGSEEDISAVVGSSSTSCPVDFEYPILDVKFSSSSGLQTADSSVAALLTDVPDDEENADVSCLLQRDVGIIINGENNLNVEEGEGSKCPVNNGNLLVDWEADYVSDGVLATTEDEGGSENARETSFSLI